jgi:DNA repair exonuclease SbcCD ATPase subunit
VADTRSLIAAAGSGATSASADAHPARRTAIVNPLRLTARNYRTFELLDYQPALGATVITGENGAGKSSIVNLIDVALFAGRGELAPLVTLGETDLELVLLFEHDNELYRVRRCLTRGKTTVDLERNALRDAADEAGERPDSWVPLTRETTEATQQLIEELLSLTRTTFRASSFLRQGDGAAFTEAQPRDRKQILAEILNLAAYDQLLARARDDIRATQRDLDITAAKITEREPLAAERDQLHGQLAVLETIEREATKDLAKAETEQERAHAALAAIEAATERVRACAAERDAVQQQVDRARAELQRVGSAAVALPAQSLARDKAITEAARVPVLEQQLDDARRANLELAAATRERAALLQQADRLNDDVVRLDREAGQLAGRAMELHAKADELAQHDDGRVCEACGQPLSTAEARAQVIVGWREQAEALMADSVAKSNDSTALEAQQSELRELAAAVTVPEARDTTAVERDLAARATPPAGCPTSSTLSRRRGRCSSRSRISAQVSSRRPPSWMSGRRRTTRLSRPSATGRRSSVTSTRRGGGCCRSASGSTARRPSTRASGCGSTRSTPASPSSTSCAPPAWRCTCGSTCSSSPSAPSARTASPP